MPSNIIKFFAYEHLPAHLQKVSAPLCDLARQIDLDLPDCAEKTAGLRKLLEAKDCFVRAELERSKEQEKETGDIKLSATTNVKPT